jgi:salicylate hydroxylase
MTSLIGLDVDIVGGGIAGLAAARALALRGATVTLHEQAPAIAEVGAGIQISPNGARVLAGLGLLEEVAARAQHSDGVTLHNQRGAPVARLDLSNRGPFLLCHRADLIETLAQGARAAGVDIRLGHPLRAAEPGPSGVTLRFDDGSRSPALALAADGGRSAVRAALEGPSDPPFTGQIAWRALLPLAPGETVPPRAQVFMGPGRHIVAYPLRSGSLLNIVAVEERARWAAEGWHHTGDPDRLRVAFAAFGPPVSDWLARIGQVMVWGLFKHSVARCWHAPGLALIGDAAHPTLPFLAQGGCLALEDAWVLADSLANTGGLPEGLAFYQARRHARANRVVAAATANARNYHLAGPARLVAHTVLRGLDRLAPATLPNRFDWLYGHDPTDGVAGF